MKELNDYPYLSDPDCFRNLGRTRYGEGRAGRAAADRTPKDRSGIHQDCTHPLPVARHVYRHRLDGHHSRQGRRGRKRRAGEGGRAEFRSRNKPDGHHRRRRIFHFRCPLCREPCCLDPQSYSAGSTDGKCEGTGCRGRSAAGAPGIRRPGAAARGRPREACDRKAYVERHIPAEPYGRKGHSHEEVRH